MAHLLRHRCALVYCLLILTIAVWLLSLMSISSYTLGVLHLIYYCWLLLDAYKVSTSHAQFFQAFLNDVFGWGGGAGTGVKHLEKILQKRRNMGNLKM